MMTIIVLWILLSIIALIVVLLHFSISAYIKVDEDGFEVKLKYFFFTIYPKKPKKQKTKKSKSIKDNKRKNEKEFSDDLDDEFSDVFFDGSENDRNNIEDSSISENVSADNTTYLEQRSGQCNDNSSKTEKKKSRSETLKKENKKTKQKKTSHKEDKKKSKSSSVKDIYNKIKPYFPMGWKYFKKLLKTIRITDVKIEVNVGREDAHEAAVYYGAVQGALFNTLGHICNMFSVKIKKANVNCIFIKNTINGTAECYIKVRPSAMIAIAFCVGINFLFVFLKQRRQNKNKSENKIENNVDDLLEVK